MARPVSIQDGKRRNMYVSDADYKALQALGGSNASLGIRKLIEEQAKWKTTQHCTPLLPSE